LCALRINSAHMIRVIVMHTLIRSVRRALVALLSGTALSARSFIHGLRQGDKVDVTYTEALAVEIKPAG
jgi:hypothetical protein